MNIEFFNNLIGEIQKDLQATKVENHLNSIVNALQNQISQPQQPQFQEQLSQELENSLKALSQAPSNKLSPIWRNALEEIGVLPILGNQLALKIKSVFEKNTITPTLALKEMSQLQNKIKTARESVTQIRNGLSFFQIKTEELEPGQCELSVMVPREAVKSSLENLGKEIVKLNKILIPFSELTIGGRPEFMVRAISSSDYNLFIMLAPQVCKAIVWAVEKVISLYKDILEIRDLKNQLTEKNVSTKIIEDLGEDCNQSTERKIQEIANEVIEIAEKKKIDAHRKNELKVEITLSLNQIANRIDRGYNFQFRIEPLKKSAPNENEEVGLDEVRDIQEILESSENLGFVKLEGQPILELPENNKDKK